MTEEAIAFRAELKALLEKYNVVIHVMSVATGIGIYDAIMVSGAGVADTRKPFIETDRGVLTAEDCR